MRDYAIRRLLMIIPTFFLLTLIVFLSARFIPGNVVDKMISELGMLGVGSDVQAATERIRGLLGLDVSVHIQYLRWLGVIPNVQDSISGLLQGNLGESLWTGRDVVGEIFRRLPISLELGALAMIIALVISLPIGILSAMRQDTIRDYSARTFAILCISLPSFWVGTMILVYPSVWWGWSPSMTYIPFKDDPLGNLGQFIIPAAVLGMVFTGSIMRITRTMMLEVLRQDYIRTAWSKGLRERTVVLRHALKNALIPVVTIVGIQLPILVSGSIILEQIFVLPGIGQFLVDAVNQRDYPVISGINVVLSIFVLLANLLVDLLYAYIDPRIRYR